MPRNGSGIFSLPSGSLASKGELILAEQHNTPLQDIANDLNAARPVSTGGTGAATAEDARTNLGVYSKTEVNSGFVKRVAAKTALKALDTALYKSAFLEEAGRQKMFAYMLGDFTAAVAGDPSEASYIPADGISVAIGCWVAVTGAGFSVQPISAGGTGAVSASAARANFGEFATKAEASAANISPTIHTITLNGFETESDGRGGQWTNDPTKGSGDSFKDRDGLTWYRSADVNEKRLTADAKSFMRRTDHQAVFVPNITPVSGTSNDMTVIIDNYGDWNNVTQTGTASLKHEHFGDGFELPNGWLGKVQRSAMTHAQANASITDIFSRNLGASWEGYRELYAPTPGYDHRGALVTVLPSGTVAIFTADVDLAADHNVITSPFPTHLRFGLVRNYRQANEEIVPLQTFFSNPYQYCQIRSVKLMPGFDGRTKLAISGFRCLNASGDMRIFMFYADIDEENDTLVNIVEGPPIYSGANIGLSEPAFLFKTPLKGIAIVRSGTGPRQYKTSDGGLTWTPMGTVPDSASNDVAHTLNLVRLDGIDYVAMAYNRRTGSQDRIRFRAGRFDDLFASLDGWLSLFDPQPYDYQNASGYQSVLQLRSGRWVMFVHKEYNAGAGAGQFLTGDNPGPTQVRMHHLDLENWIRYECTWSPTIIAATLGGTAVTYSEQAGSMTQYGNLILLTATVQASNWTLTGNTGAVSIGGLPVMIRNSRAARGATDIWAVNVDLKDIAVTINGTPATVHCDSIIGLYNNATNRIDLYKKTPNGAVALTADQLKVTAAFVFEIFLQRV